MEELIHFDQQLLLLLNGSDSLFLDSIILTLTNAKTWIPLYLSLFYVVVKSNDTVGRILLVLAAAGLCVFLAGTIDDAIVKPLVARWRPGNDPQIGLLVDTVDGYRGGNYGFFSAHASNTFSIALFFSLLMRRRLLTVALVLWSLVNCYTRLYLGVHYPGDITVGLLWGALVGWGVYRFFYCRFATPTVYSETLCDIPVAVLCLTLFYAVMKAFIFIF
ncbi:MAG: phosphatase PAP2 family protein [Prevotella sp.]|nr:phosphatase PAP2 family protein [Prevotella sp.]